MLRRNREIVIFNLSAIDLFCSGMGAVMVLMVLLMPYYRNEQKSPNKIEPEPSIAVNPPAALEPPQPPQPAPPEPEKAVRIRAIDVVFVMDATKSMDEELSAVKSGMTSVVQVLRRLSDEVRVGFVAYIDRAVPWTIPLLSMEKGKEGDVNLRQLLRGIDEVKLVGNEDWPEDVCAGLTNAVSLGWTSAADRRQMIVVIGDARTHPEDRQRSFDTVREWAAVSDNRNVNTVFTATEDQDPEWRAEKELAKQYFQDLAKTGKGQFLDEQAIY
jgi:hypothetical protein